MSDYDFSDAPTDFSFLGRVTVETAPPKLTRTTSSKLVAATSSHKRVRTTSTGIAYTYICECSDETRAKISAALKGKTRKKGKTLSAEHRANMSAAAKGKPKSAEHRANMSAGLKGRTLSAEHRANLKISHCKPIMTPSGVFPSKRAAGEWAQAHGLRNPHQKIRKWLKTHPKLFYYIKKETI